MSHKILTSTLKLVQSPSSNRCLRLFSSSPNLRSKIVEEKTKTKRTYFDDEIEDDDLLKEQPVRFSSSKGTTLKSEHLGIGYGAFKGTSAPDIQTPSILLSMVAFGLYFFYFREENDLDIWAAYQTETMYDAAPKLERQHVEVAIQAYTAEGKDTTLLQEKLKEIIERENENKNA